VSARPLVTVRRGRYTATVTGPPAVIVPALATAALGGRWGWDRPGRFQVPLDVVDDLLAVLQADRVQVTTTGTRAPVVDPCDCLDLLRRVLGAEEIT
jgi:hypothetical protein